MFNGLIPVARKEVVHLSRDRGTVFFAALVPFVQLLMFGYALDLNVRQIPAVVLDEAPSQRGRELVERFRATDIFNIQGYAQSQTELEGLIRAGRAQAAIVIPYDYGTRIIEGRKATVQLLVDGSDSTVSNAALGAFNNVILLENQRALRVGQAAVEGRPTVLFNPATKAANFFIPGLLAILVQIMVVLLVALSVVREAEKGTLEQLTLTPVQPLGLMIGKMVPYVALGFFETCGIIVIMRVVFNVPVNGNLGVLLLLTVPLLVAVAALGLLISTRANSQAEAFQLAMGTMLPSIFLSGYIFPITNMPLFFQYISRVIPATYYIETTRGVILRGAGLTELWVNGAVLLGMATVLLIAAARQFHRKLG